MNPTLVGFVKKELTQAVRDPRMKVLLFVMPVIQMTLFGVAISNEVKNIRLAAYFEPKDAVMRDIYERAVQGGWFIPARAEGAGASDPFELIRSDKADAVLVAPPGGFTKGLGRRDATLQLLVDATNVVQAQSVEAYLRQITAQVLADDLGLKVPEPPIRFDVRVLFNPSLDTSIFMVPGVMAMVMVLTTMVLTNISITREKELGTFEMLISAPVARWEVIVGKTIPFILIGLADLPLVLSVAVFLFKVPMRGSFLSLVLAAFAFVCTTVALGTLVSTFCANQQQAIMGGFLVTFPMIMFSGLLFPIENMPLYVRWMAYCDPLSHFLTQLRSIMLKGGDIHSLWAHVGAQFALAAAAVTWSFRRFHTTLG